MPVIVKNSVPGSGHSANIHAWEVELELLQLQMQLQRLKLVTEEVQAQVPAGLSPGDCIRLGESVEELRAVVGSALGSTRAPSEGSLEVWKLRIELQNVRLAKAWADLNRA